MEGAERKCENPACARARAGAEPRPKLMLCSRCHGIQYCSVDCQRAHFAEHRTVCVPPDPVWS